MCLSLVPIYPGHLYIPVLTQRNITCSVEEGRFTSLFVIFNDDRSTARRFGVVERREYVTGIAIIFAIDKKVLVSVNTIIISVTGISCKFEIVTDSEATQDENILNITIYGK